MFEKFNSLSEQEQYLLLRVISSLEIRRIQGFELPAEQITTGFNTLPENLREIGAKIYADMGQKSTLSKASKDLERFLKEVVVEISVRKLSYKRSKSMIIANKVVPEILAISSSDLDEKPTIQEIDQSFHNRISHLFSPEKKPRRRKVDGEPILIGQELPSRCVSVPTPEQKEKPRNSNSFLFSSVQAAQEVADLLRGKWDHSNGVELINCDYAALKLAATLCNAEYCRTGNCCNVWMRFKCLPL